METQIFKKNAVYTANLSANGHEPSNVGHSLDDTQLVKDFKH